MFPAGVPGGAGGSVVVAAVDDDDNASEVLGYAAARAREHGVPLRVVHVWGDRPGERMPEADLLLAYLLYDCLPDADASAAEREILHDEPVPALIALSREALLLVVSASSAPVSAGRPLGDTAQGLAGRTACPLAVVASGEQPAAMLAHRAAARRGAGISRNR